MNKISIISSLIILFLLAIPLGVAHYLTDWDKDLLAKSGQGQEQGQAAPEFQEDSRIFDSRVLLRKDKAVTVNNSRLVFRGVEERRIRLDLYLLELDPDYAYPQYISRAESGRPFRLGDTQFQLLDVSGGVLQLRIVELFKS